MLKFPHEASANLTILASSSPSPFLISLLLLSPSFLPSSFSFTSSDMKLSVDSLLSSFNKSSSKSKKKKSTSVDASSYSSSSSSSLSEELSNAAGSLTTPRSVLPKTPPPLVFLPLHELFNVFDRDGDGKITTRELEAVLPRLVPADNPPTAEEVACMVAEVDRDGDGSISLEEFAALEAALAGAAAAASRGAADEMRDAFAVFDADGDGKISAEELLGVFVTLGDGECTLEDCRRMIGSVDTDGDGFVCFEDFVRMMDGQR
ncbi:putative calcium-binding protein CML18 [Canna indica]|uniref:Calcium-binding protein CML18 n=1 Tax=Canna indica TaxID=4628 RepID=A0AAQ3KDM6_9LILI|nr:putative calcium-binding protein CML18 [Canna indica]